MSANTATSCFANGATSDACADSIDNANASLIDSRAFRVSEPATASRTPVMPTGTRALASVIYAGPHA